MLRFILLVVLTLSAACAPSPGRTNDVVRIGMSAAPTGPNAAVYAAVHDALVIYVKRLNQNGGVNGRRIELVVADDTGDATRASTNATRLVQQEKVPLLVLASPSAAYGPVMSIS